MLRRLADVASAVEARSLEGVDFAAWSDAVVRWKDAKARFAESRRYWVAFGSDEELAAVYDRHHDLASTLEHHDHYHEHADRVIPGAYENERKIVAGLLALDIDEAAMLCAACHTPPVHALQLMRKHPALVKMAA